MVLLPILFASTQVDQIIARNEAFLAKAKTLSVSIEASMYGLDKIGRGQLIFQRPDKLCFKLKWDSEDYELRLNPQYSMEVDWKQRLYQQNDSTHALVAYPSEISSLMKYGYPSPLLGKGIRRLFPQSSSTKYLGVEQIGGKKSDHLQVKASTPMEELQIDAWIGEDGSITQYRMLSTAGGQKFIGTLKLTNYKLNQSYPASTFLLEPPIGCSPYRFDSESAIVSADTNLKLPTIKDASGKMFSLSKWLGGKPGIIIIGAKGCAISRSLVHDVNKQPLPIRSLLITSDKTLKLTENQTVYDFDNKCLDSVTAPGSPVIVLVSGSGKVIQVWYGYDQTDPGSLRSEINRIAVASGVIKE